MPPPKSTVPGTGHQEASVLRGIGLITATMALMSVMDALVKWLAADYSTVQIVFFRSLFAFVPLVFLLFRDGLMSALRVRSPVWQGLRCLVGLGAMVTFFHALGLMPLADVIAIAFAAPLFVTALSVPILGEVVGLRRWTAVGIGFLGVLIMIEPGPGVFRPVALVPLVAALFYALAMVLTRRLTRTETSASIVFYYAVVATLASGALLPFHWVTPDLIDFCLLASVGLVGGLGQILLTAAYRHAEASTLAPFDYTAMVWAVVLGYFIWDEIPGMNIWIGVVVVAASGIYIVYREAQLRLPRGQARRLQTRR